MIEKITIQSDIENLTVIENMVDTLSKRLGVSDEVYGKILVSTVEAVNNAIIHGNKGDVRKSVIVEISADGNIFEVTVTDEGKGFEYDSLPDPTRPENIENLHGRGVFLMRNLTDFLDFNESGNEVRMNFNY
ncbi:MAG: ATP-binding protein [Bacteroidia bacterium]|nr:MAG: ATP-binding protein [Bacteroidia bacterium]